MNTHAEPDHAPTPPSTHTGEVPTRDARSGALVEHALVGLAELDRDGVFTLVNPHLCAILGYSAAELLDRRFHDITHPDDLAHCDAQFRQAVATGESFAMDKRYVRPDGTVVWVSDSVSVLHDATGQPHRVVMVVTDITARKQAEAAVRASDAKYRTLFESIDEGFCVMEMLFDERGTPVDYRFLETNAVFEHQTGLVHAVGKTARELVPNLEAHWFDIYGTVALTGQSVRFEQHADAMQDRWFDVYASRIGGDDSRHVALVFKDITARKRRDANLAFLADITDAMSRLSTAEEIMTTVGAHIGAYLNIKSCMLVDVDDAHGEVTVFEAWDAADMPSLRYQTLPLANYLTEEFSRASRAGETVVMRDMRTDPRGGGKDYPATRIEAFVTVPFHRNGVWTNYVVVTDSRPRDWREDQIELFRELANRIFPRLERARAEAAVRESETRLRRTLSIDTVGVLFFDGAGGFTDANDAFLTMSGFSRAALEQHALRTEDMTLPEWMPRTRQALAELQATGRITPYAKELVRPDGSRWWGLFAGTQLNDHENVEFVLNITDRKQAEAALAASEERLRLVIESVQDYAIFTIDPTGQVTSWNDGARQLKGYTAEEIVGQPVERFYTPADVAAGKVAHEMQTALTLGRSEDESWRVRKDGARLWVNEIMTPLYAADGTHLGFTKISRDMTARKQAEDDRTRALAAAQAARAEAEAALRTREQFLSIASHELRTPLTSLLGYAMLLPQAIARGTGQVDKMTDRIVRQAQRLNGLIDQLLDVSRLQQGQFVIARGPLDLAALVRQVVDEVRATVPATSTHTVRLTAPSAPVRIDGDAERLEQVLHNLLSNALKYSPQGGTVQVAVHDTATKAVVEITDQGIGIPADAQARLFEPFYRAPNVGGQASGFGLGLHIVREIVARHGGRMEVDSTEGVGSTFRVVLPLQASVAAQDTAGSPPA